MSQDEYLNKPIKNIIFGYIIRDGKINNKLSTITNVTMQTISNRFKLPITFNPLDYGNLIYHDKINNVFVMRISKTNNAVIKCENINDQIINDVKIEKDGIIQVKYKDIKIDENIFIRKLNSSEYRYFNNELQLITKDVRTKFIEPIDKSKEECTSFLTMDIETVKINGTLTPYLISAYNGENYFTTYINNFKDQNLLFKSFIEQILSKYYPYSKCKIRKLENFIYSLYLLPFLYDK